MSATKRRNQQSAMLAEALAPIYRNLEEKLQPWSQEENNNGILARDILRARAEGNKQEEGKFISPILRRIVEGLLEIQEPPTSEFDIDVAMTDEDLESAGIKARYAVAD